MSEFGGMILWCSLQVTLFLVLASVIYGAAAGLGPRVRALVALATLLTTGGLMLLAASPWPRWDFEVLYPAPQPVGRGEPAPLSQDDSARTGPPSPRAASDHVRAGADTSFADAYWSALAEQVKAGVVVGHDGEGSDWRRWIGTAFLGGAGLALAWRLLGLFAMRRQIAEAESVRDSTLLELVDVIQAELRIGRRIDLKQSGLISTAATVSWPRPIVLLPKTSRRWTVTECRAILAHELAHISRHDFGCWLLAQAALLLNYYHPLAHWFARRMRLEQELAADALAVRVVGAREEYLTTLAQLALRTPEQPTAWPVQAFLPARSTFLRRIEMLRKPHSLDANRFSRPAGGLSLVTILILGVLVSGLRWDNSTPLVMAQDLTAAPNRTARAELPVHLLFDGATVLGEVRPAQLLAGPQLAAQLQQLNGMLEQGGIELRVEQIDTVWLIANLAKQQSRTVVRTKEPFSSDKLGLNRGREQHQRGGHSYYAPANGGAAVLFPYDALTLVIDEKEAHTVACIDSMKADGKYPAWWDRWGKLPAGQVHVFADLAAIAAALPQDVESPMFAMFSPILLNSKEAFVTLDFADATELIGVVSTQGADQAEQVRATLDAALVFGRNFIAQRRQRFDQDRPGPPELAQQLKKTMDIAMAMLSGAKTSVDGDEVKLQAESGKGRDVALVIATVLPALEASRAAARRAQSINNLKQLTLACLLYESDKGHFPAAVGYGPNNVPHSWRVAILPYLEAGHLHDMYRFDEPWDSENNKQVLRQMPAVFRAPDAKTTSTFASYFAPVGKGTIMFGESNLRSITDGASKTVLLTEAKREIPWTKPEDLTVSPDKPLPDFGGWLAGDIFLVSFADGSVIAVTKSIDQNLMRNLLTKADGQRVDIR